MGAMGAAILANLHSRPETSMMRSVPHERLVEVCYSVFAFRREVLWPLSGLPLCWAEGPRILYIMSAMESETLPDCREAQKRKPTYSCRRQ